MDAKLFLFGQLLMFGWMTALYFVQRAKRDGGVLDVGWTGGIGLMAILLALGVDGLPARRALVAILAVLWSARLCVHLLNDRVIGRPEDDRYRKLREHWGGRAQLFFLLAFEAQAVLILLFSVPLWVAMKHPAPALTWWDALGLLVWTIAVGGEIIADRQLAAFRADPAHRGRTCRAGLWKTSRHPNYFFEWLHWWAYVFIAAGAPGFWLAWLGPAAMGLFLFKLTGIPYTEKQALASRGEDYRAYQRTTSVFVPWFPKTPGARRDT